MLHHSPFRSLRCNLSQVSRKVWKVVEDQAIEQEVLLGSRRGNWIEITSGIQAGDEIVIESAKGKRALVTRIGDSLSNTKPMDPSSEPPL